MTKSERALSRWGLLIAGDQGPILAGCEGFGIRRTSTPLIEFDPLQMTAVTSTGRPYRLVGEPEPGYALMAFHSLWDTGDLEVRILSPTEAVALIEQNGNCLFDRTPEEQAALDRKKLEFLSAQVRQHMTLNGIDEREAALWTGLSASQLCGLLNADLSLVSADEADQAFVRLVGMPFRGPCFLVHDEVEPSYSGWRPR